MSISNYGAQAWIGVMFGLNSLPGDFYVALCTAEPGVGWDGTVLQTVEPVDTAYSRVAVANPAGWTLSDGGFVINVVELDFGVPLVNWGNITHFALCDDPVSGFLWSYGPFLDAIYVPAGYPPKLAIGSIYHALGNQLASIAG